MSSSGVDIEYPPLSEALYKAHSLDEAQQIYVSMLYETGNIYHTQYAAKLEHAKMSLSSENIKQLESDFIAFKDHMRIWSNQSGIQISIQRRQKDFLGLNAKIRLFLASGKNLSQINDLLGFRIILKTDYPDCEESIKHCYDVLNEVFSFFALKRGCMFLEAEPRVGDDISEDKANELGLVIPTQNWILDGFANNVKDYIAFPKANGYQSLHTLVLTPSGLIFEVQVRTTFMDILAEFGSGRHSNYKLEKYKNSDIGEIDFSKINMPGFRALPNGEIYDRIGLQEAVDPFNLLH